MSRSATWPGIPGEGVRRRPGCLAQALTLTVIGVGRGATGIGDGPRSTKLHDDNGFDTTERAEALRAEERLARLASDHAEVESSARQRKFSNSSPNGGAAETLGELSAAGRLWLTRFATTPYDDHEILWEEFLGSVAETEIHQRLSTRMAALRPEVAVLVVESGRDHPELGEALDDVSRAWLR